MSSRVAIRLLSICGCQWLAATLTAALSCGSLASAQAFMPPLTMDSSLRPSVLSVQ
ncbi:hypothetical protein D3C85_1526490 [compost metagenome]